MEYTFSKGGIEFKYGYLDGSELADAIIDAGTKMDEQDISRDARYVKLTEDQIKALHEHINRETIPYRGTNEAIRRQAEKPFVFGSIDGMKIIKVDA